MKKKDVRLEPEGGAIENGIGMKHTKNTTGATKQAHTNKKTSLLRKAANKVKKVTQEFEDRASGGGSKRGTQGRSQTTK